MNMQVVVPSTPAQMFHLLRRQMLRPMRKPLIIITPKSLLRHKEAVSTLEHIANGEFQVVIPDSERNYDDVTRIILCSGKIYYELLDLRAKVKAKEKIAIIRIE